VNNCLLNFHHASLTGFNSHAVLYKRHGVDKFVVSVGCYHVHVQCVSCQTITGRSASSKGQENEEVRRSLELAYF